MRIETNTLTPEVFLELYASVGWEPPCMEQICRAINHSTATFTVYHREKAVGMVRLIGDGGMSFYVKDFAVLPSYQSKGVGTLLLDALEQKIKDSIPAGWAVSLELISTREAVPFYRKKGFEDRPCDWDGPGMFKMIRKI
ncbi:MAG: GNAT family N-acetyltransferase [Oscillospiraceae bacterium]|nr:GNAT family N-acetyltransferase [Oscillospiraceae bacterium]